MGNIALKIVRRLVEHIGGMLKKAHQEILVSQLGYVLSKGAFDDFPQATDYSEYGGAPLLGVRGITVIGTAGPIANAIKNAIRVAAELCRARAERKNRTGAFRCRAVPARG